MTGPDRPGEDTRTTINRRALVAGAGGIVAGLSVGAAAVPRGAAPPLPPESVATLSVRDFGARGDGKASDGHAIRAAIAEARRLDHLEKRIVFPAGIYRVDTIDLTGTRGVVLLAEGTVQLVGTGGEFIVGARRDAGTGNDGSVYNFRMEGGQFLLSAEPGASYRHGLQIHGFVLSSLSAVSVSGEFGRGEFERAAVTIDRSWCNRFVGLTVACPGVPGAGRRSVAIRCDEDNVNVNHFESCRISGVAGEPGLSGTVGIVLNGTANRISNCDISAVATGVELKAARGCTLSDNYHESVRRIVVADKGNSRGCVFTGGYYEIGADTTAFSLGSSEATTIIGGYYRGSGGGTFVDRGDACYGLTVIEPMLENVGTAYRGRERGAVGAGAAATRLSAAGIVFPQPQAASDDARTLDDYEEGRFIPRGNGFTFEGGTSFTKIGDTVTLRFRLAFPPSGSREEAALINLPFPAAANEGAGVALGDQRNPAGNALAVRGDRLVVIDPRTGAARTNAEVGGNFYSGVAHYRAAPLPG
jgi:hypothetical protein